MDHRTIPNYNQIQIQFLSDFVEGVLEQVDTEKYPEEVTKLNNLVSLFESQLALFSHSEEAGLILDLENLRNEQLEIILDRLDDHLNVAVQDDDNDLAVIGMSEKEVLSGLSGFQEVYRLLGSNGNSEPDFHSRFDRTGHLWEELRYRDLLNRFESGEYEEEAEVLGIAGKALEVLALDHRQERIAGKASLAEELKELRKLRYLIREALEPLYHDIYDSELFTKEHHKIPVIELLIDDINAKNELVEMEKFSINDQTHEQLAEVIESVSTIPEDKREEWEEAVTPVLASFRKVISVFSTEKCWHEFEQSEMILYHCVERFLWELPSNLRCAVAEEYSALHEKFRTSPRYLTTIEILNDLQARGIHVDRSFSRGSAVVDTDIPLLLAAFEEEGMKEKLDLLRLCPLVKEMCESDALSRELIDPVVHKFNTKTLEEFRALRSELTGFYCQFNS